MSHELTEINGRTSMAYAEGVKPWHSLGQELSPNASLDTWATEAGMDHRILRSKVRFAVDRDGGDFQTMDDSHVLFRSDNHAPMGIVSDRYQIVQPRQVLEFFAGTAEAAGFTLETAGTLFGGKKYWALARTPNERAVMDSRDKIREYLLLSTSADGSSPTEGRFTSVCVVCWNTLQASLSGTNGGRYAISHRTVFDPDIMRRELGVDDAESRFDTAVAEFTRMAQTPLGDTETLMATADLFKPKWRELDRKEQNGLFSRPKSPIAQVARLALDHKALGAEMDGRSDTVYAWLNCISEYTGHHARASGPDNGANNRVNSDWFGPGNALKQRAYEMAQSMVVRAAEARPVYTVGTMTGEDMFRSLLNAPVTTSERAAAYSEAL